MRILQVIPAFTASFGGTSSVVRMISTELAKKHEVVVYTTTALDPKHDFDPREEEATGYKVVYFERTFKGLCHSGIFGQLNLSYDMMQAVKRNLRDFDVVHVHSWMQFPDVLVHHFATTYGVPYVLQVHGSLPKLKTRQGLKLAFDVFFGQRLLKDASKIIAFTHSESRQFQAAGVLEAKIEVIPNGIDLSEYLNLPRKGSFKKKFNVQNDTKIILYVGRIHKSKRIDFLVNAYAYLIKTIKCTNLLLVIAGPDDGYLKNIKTLVYSLGLTERVLFVGLLSEEDKICVYVDSAICAYMNPDEPFGIVPLEAAASGKPVVVVSGTPMSEIVSQGKFGVSIRSGDITELAKTMLKILQDEELADEMGARGRDYIFANFAWSNMVVSLSKIYEEVAKVKSAGPLNSADMRR